jgi:resuscitation-promoting factor RpfB
MSSPFPPPPEQPSKSKPIWKQWWLWAIIVVLILIAAGAGIAATTQTETEADSPSPSVSATTTTTTPVPLPAVTALVPDVDGKSVEDATAKVQAAGLEVSVQTKMTNQAPKGTVVSTAPFPGSTLEVGDTVTLTVAQPFPKIPHVVGKTLANAKQSLKNAGFEVGRVTQQTSTKKKGTVISQSPDAGTSARPGRAVSLVTAKPPPPQPNNCTPGYSPCLPPASDYDCLGGTGDGPAYTGFVRVTGSDPYGLDGDGDGFGCE